MAGSLLRHFSPPVFRPQAGLPWGIENTLSESVNPETLVINTKAKAIRSFPHQQARLQPFSSRRRCRQPWAAYFAAT